MKKNVVGTAAASVVVAGLLVAAGFTFAPLMALTSAPTPVVSVSASPTPDLAAQQSVTDAAVAAAAANTAAATTQSAAAVKVIADAQAAADAAAAQPVAAAPTPRKAATIRATTSTAPLLSGNPKGTPLPFIPSADPQNANHGDYTDPSAFCAAHSASTVAGVPVCD